MNWVKDDYGWVFEVQGWTIRDWTNSGIDCTGPEGRFLEYNSEANTVSIYHEAPYEGSVSAEVPVGVLEEFLRVSLRERGKKNERNQ